ncbi:tryptophan synthase alpha chain [Paenibacillus forsythiae]|uniref:Tryptophan synthase alpha chain n=1 Tax=Paenibacillus forsythiae TaxID=365616 RepID=A0ABU3H7W1_9BACL|nr:tryptophan synthase subunit alpha [Paenibacillus forsythiae]MDT3426541.1 tryptophan synthase alpha chain [Paenibacillus forsythiae]
MNLIDQTFEELQRKQQTAFIPFITAGDPDVSTTLDLMRQLQQSGANLIELGVPYSDPLADGPVIQQASIRALSNHITIVDVIGLAKQAREAGIEIPLILFTYYNPLLQAGLENSFSLMAASGIDGIIVPDLPVEESDRVRFYCEHHNIHYIPLVAPTSQERIRPIVDGASGFVYCVSSLGVTGQRKNFYGDIEEFLVKVRESTHLPIIIGFGISDNNQYKRFTKLADGIVVGSAIVHTIEENLGLLKQPATYSQGMDNVRDFITRLLEV